MSFRYVIAEGIAGIKRARLAAFTSVFSLFIAILLLGILTRVSFNGYQIAQSMKNRIDIEVFLLDVEERTRDNIRYKIENDPLVQNIHYISKDSAARIFRSQFGSEGGTLTDLDFLPASFRVEINEEASSESVNALVNKIKHYRGVDDVKFNQRLLQMLESRFDYLVKIGSGIGALILFAALILVFNTIRLTIYAKRSLIKSMKLVGATNKFIRRPFIIEGIIQGLIAGTAALLVIYLLFSHLLPSVLPQIGILDWPFGKWYYLSAAMLLLAMVMGYIGSRWAAQKFIKKTSISD
jgi:cell division transport system permease protein